MGTRHKRGGRFQKETMAQAKDCGGMGGRSEENEVDWGSARQALRDRDESQIPL